MRCIRAAALAAERKPPPRKWPADRRRIDEAWAQAQTNQQGEIGFRAGAAQGRRLGRPAGCVVLLRKLSQTLTGPPGSSSSPPNLLIYAARHVKFRTAILRRCPRRPSDRLHEALRRSSSLSKGRPLESGAKAALLCKSASWLNPCLVVIHDGGCRCAAPVSASEAGLTPAKRVVIDRSFQIAAAFPQNPRGSSQCAEW